MLEAPRYDVKPLFILMSQSSRISGKPCDQFVCMKLSGSIKPFVQWLDIGYKNVSSVSSLHIFSPPSLSPSLFKITNRPISSLPQSIRSRPLASPIIEMIG